MKSDKTVRLVLVSVILALAVIFMVPAKEVMADDMATALKVTITAANGESTARIRDDSYSTRITFTADNPITVSASGENKIYGLYITWASQPGTWTLQYDGGAVECGQNGFLHEYVSIPEGTENAVIMLSQKESICNISAYSKGQLPDDVQVWSPSCDKADILLLSTHADDEILFFGGILPEYAGERGLKVQLVYFSNYFGGTVIREHEKLDGLWHAGVRNYPVNGEFPDNYADTLEAAKKVYNYDTALEFVVEQIRRFKPQICIAQDTNGEYGHGTHMLTSAAMQEAVTISMDASAYPESAKQYGVWDVPKTYIHLYRDNAIKLNCRKPLDKFGGKNSLEIAAEAYKKHVSQQWCWFYVSDTYEYSIADFGLFRTTVGTDAGNDIMENITSYSEQERIKAEKKAAMEASRQAAEEASRLQEEKASYEREYGVPKGEASADKVPNFLKTTASKLIFMVICAVVLVTAFAGIHIIMERYRQRRNRRRRRNGD